MRVRLPPPDRQLSKITKYFLDARRGPGEGTPKYGMIVGHVESWERPASPVQPWSRDDRFESCPGSQLRLATERTNWCESAPPGSRKGQRSGPNGCQLLRGSRSTRPRTGHEPVQEWAPWPKNSCGGADPVPPVKPNQAESGRARTPRGTDRPLGSRLSEHRIRDGDVVTEGFGGPLGERASRRAPGGSRGACRPAWPSAGAIPSGAGTPISTCMGHPD